MLDYRHVLMAGHSGERLSAVLGVRQLGHDRVMQAMEG